MRVFAVLNDYGYEGYGAPIGVYSTLEKAEEVRSQCLSDHHGVEIYEYSLDDQEEVG